MPGFPIVGDLALTEDGRDIAVLDGQQKILQSIRTRAGIFLGSWRYDRTKGVPYFQEILQAGASIELTRRRFQELLLGTDGVTSVTSLDIVFDQEAEEVQVNFTCNAVAGQVSGSLDFVAA